MRVKLQRETLKGGRVSLFLNIYVGDGKYKRKSLKLYLKPEQTSSDKELNKSILKEAELIRNSAELKILNKSLGKENPRDKYQNSFLNYYGKLLSNRYETGTNYDTWLSVWRHLNKYSNESLLFDELDHLWLDNFRLYLLSKLSQNSAQSYFNVLLNSLHQAVRDKLYDSYLWGNVKNIKQVNTKREYLTIEEIKILMNTDCRLPSLKRAFLFSCMTGLRWSDIVNLRWENIVEEEGITYLRYTQRKTNSYEKLPISNEALPLLSIKAEPTNKIFEGLKYSAWHNSILSQWVLISGIKKHITFHCARHSHATLLLTSNVDIYTVSKLLGHKDIRTTEIYAKLLPHKKVEAIQKIPSFYTK